MGQEAWMLTNGSWLCDLQGAKSFPQVSVSKSANSKVTNPGSRTCGLDESLPLILDARGEMVGSRQDRGIRKYRGQRGLILSP